MPEANNETTAQWTPAGFGAKKDANAFVYPMLEYEGVYFVRFGLEESGAWGPNGGKVSVGSGETMLKGAIREFKEENAGVYELSAYDMLSHAKIFATKNHFDLPEFLYFLNFKSTVSEKPVRDALAHNDANCESAKTCPFRTVRAHMWIAFSDITAKFFNDSWAGQYPYYTGSADNSLAADQMIRARTLEINDDNAVQVVEKELMIRRNGAPSHFRNITYAPYNEKINMEK
jgi:hypothetical protein